MGYADVAQRRSRSSTSRAARTRRRQLVPDELVDEIHIIGDAGEVRERVKRMGGGRGDHAAADSCRTPEEVRRVAEVVLG